MTRTLTPWGTRRLFDFERDLPKWMTDIFAPEAGLAAGDFQFVPEANVTETDKAIQIVMDLPGLKSEDVKVELHDRMLSVSGERKEEQEESGKTFHRVERRSGGFRRNFNLPVEVEEDKVDARFADGVLTVTLPKSEASAPRKIEVRH